ncbi:MAG: coproporphyrinogen III oxidase [Flavobacteriales bacterium]|nr:coproporphyrinogen III oxidase [Flavobacteriales bacterium]
MAINSLFGIYIHIPFCKKACTYCDFHFSTAIQSKQEVLTAILHEISSRKQELNGVVDSIYFGGGTPTAIDLSDLNRILSSIKKNYVIAENPEITIEINPEDLSKIGFIKLKEIGFNRLSIGVQSFQDNVLKWMNRSHSSKKAIDAVVHAQAAGFGNISIDLIYGLPVFLNRNWNKDIDIALSLNVQHISSYNLTKEKSTKLYMDVKKGKYTMPTQDICSQEFKLLVDKLTKKRFEQYEASNFSLNGYRSTHNSSYWSFKPYLGIGPSAHSYNGKNIRRWNVSNNKKYSKNVLSFSDYFQQEKLSNEDLANELILLGTRSDNGVDLNRLFSLLNNQQEQSLIKQIKALKEKELITQQNNKLIVFADNFLFSDYIARELFILPL